MIRSGCTAKGRLTIYPAPSFAGVKQCEFETTAQGFRIATSVGGVLTGRGADMIIIDDPPRPEEALSQAQRQAANEWCDHTLYVRLNDKLSGAIVVIAIVVIMHRLHEDDLAGRVLAQEEWDVMRLLAIAEEDEWHRVETVFGRQVFGRRAGEALHPEREPPEILAQLRRTLGEYTGLPPATVRTPIGWPGLVTSQISCANLFIARRHLLRRQVT